MDDFALELGPTVDDLVGVARVAGEASARRRTINSWVAAGYVLRPRQRQRKWRYPNAAVGQVDTLARMRARDVHKDFFHFGLFVETGIGDHEAARAFLLEFLGYWKHGLANEKDRLSDLDTFREEARVVARKKGKHAPLPHRVRMTLDERTQAMQFVLSLVASVQLPVDEQEEGQRELERLLGLRSGRGGDTRDLSDFADLANDKPPDADALIEAVETASLERIEYMRRMVEIGIVWFPAMRSMLAAVVGSASASTALVDVMEEWEQKMTPDAYALLFATGLANARRKASDEQIAEALSIMKPDMAALMLLSECTTKDRELAVRRLRPYPRMRLQALTDRLRRSPIDADS